jgi:transposase
MNYDKKSLKILVDACRRNGLSPIMSHDFITTAWPECVSLRRVEQIMKELQSTGDDVPQSEKEETRGRPRLARTAENIAIVKDCITQHPNWSLDILENELDISSSTIHRILREELGLVWKIARWIPHLLTDAQKAKRVDMCKEVLKVLRRRSSMSRIIVVDEKIVYHTPIGTKNTNAAWITPGGDQPTIARRTQFDHKTMVVVAITFTGKVHSHCMLKGETIDSDAYIRFIEEVFRKFSRHVEPLTPSTAILMHDNARVHVSAKTQQFLAASGISVLNQPPYSPDVNALDRFAFTFLERKRKDITFADSNEVNTFVADTLKTLSLDRLKHEYETLQQDLKEIINKGGDYL